MYLSWGWWGDRARIPSSVATRSSDSSGLRAPERRASSSQTVDTFHAALAGVRVDGDAEEGALAPRMLLSPGACSSGAGQGELESVELARERAPERPGLLNVRRSHRRIRARWLIGTDGLGDAPRRAASQPSTLSVDSIGLRRRISVRRVHGPWPRPGARAADARAGAPPSAAARARGPGIGAAARRCRAPGPHLADESLGWRYRGRPRNSYRTPCSSPGIHSGWLETNATQRSRKSPEVRAGMTPSPMKGSARLSEPMPRA